MLCPTVRIEYCYKKVKHVLRCVEITWSTCAKCSRPSVISKCGIILRKMIEKQLLLCSSVGKELHGAVPL